MTKATKSRRPAPRTGRPLTDPDHPLTSRRVARNWTQGDLAVRAGCALQTVSLIERGDQRNPTRRVVEGIAAALGIDARTLAAEIALGKKIREK